jgi:hypothetical protein
MTLEQLTLLRNESVESLTELLYIINTYFTKNPPNTEIASKIYKLESFITQSPEGTQYFIKPFLTEWSNYGIRKTILDHSLPSDVIYRSEKDFATMFKDFTIVVEEGGI